MQKEHPEGRTALEPDVTRFLRRDTEGHQGRRHVSGDPEAEGPAAGSQQEGSSAREGSRRVGLRSPGGLRDGRKRRFITSGGALDLCPGSRPTRADVQLVGDPRLLREELWHLLSPAPRPPHSPRAGETLPRSHLLGPGRPPAIMLLPEPPRGDSHFLFLHGSPGAPAVREAARVHGCTYAPTTHGGPCQSPPGTQQGHPALREEAPR